MDVEGNTLMNREMWLNTLSAPDMYEVQVGKLRVRDVQRLLFHLKLHGGNT